MIYRFLERHGLHIHIFRQNRDAQHPTNDVQPQDTRLREHRGDTRQDVQVETLEESRE